MADNDNDFVIPVSFDAAEAQPKAEDDAKPEDDAPAVATAAPQPESGAPVPAAPAGVLVRDAEEPLPPVGDNEPEVPLGTGVSDDWKHIVVRDRQIAQGAGDDSDE